MSHTPMPEKDGLRRYGQGMGERKEDLSKCAAQVITYAGRYAHFHQCERKRGHGPGGIYCKQHDPAVVTARHEAASKAYHDKWANSPLELARKRIESLEAQIREMGGTPR